jgi:copper chaperone CopZ
MTTTTYAVVGLTCGHCVAAVTEEVSRIDGVRGVEVDLVPGGVSTLTVTSEPAPVDDAELAAALDEAGDYRLAERP